MGKNPKYDRAYLVFGDIEDKLDVLRVECTKCDRNGQYHVHKLIEKYGRQHGNMTMWRNMLNGDCPKRDGRLHDRCDPPSVPTCRRYCEAEAG